MRLWPASSALYTCSDARLVPPTAAAAVELLLAPTLPVAGEAEADAGKMSTGAASEWADDGDAGEEGWSAAAEEAEAKRDVSELGSLASPPLAKEETEP